MTAIVKIVTLSGDTLDVSVETTDKVFDIKKKVFEMKGQGYEPALLKLIFQGRIMRDDTCISEYSLSSLESGRMVAIGANAKTELSTKVIHQTPSKKSIVLENDQILKLEFPICSRKYPMVCGSKNRTDLINYLEKMGVSKEKLYETLAITNYDPSKAFDYVIKLDVMPNKRQRIEFLYEGGGNPSSTDSTTKKPTSLSNFINHPIFERLSKDLINEPTLMIPMLAELRKHDPDILEYILSNPAEFGQIIKENYDKAYIGPPNPNPTNSKLGREQVNNFIETITGEEKSTLRDLENFGFTSEDITKAYYLCDKNLTLTVEYLLFKTEFFEDDQ